MIGAFAAAFLPRRKRRCSSRRSRGALLIGFEVVLTHWFYLYIPWFFPFVAFAVLARWTASSAEPDGEVPLSPRFAAIARLRRDVDDAALIGFYKHRQIVDTPVYQRYGNAIAHGHVPYRDFQVEYPPGALPLFALPGLVSHGGRDQDVRPGFRRSFETLMWMCGAAALLAMARRCALRVIARRTSGRRSAVRRRGATCCSGP